MTDLALARIAGTGRLADALAAALPATGVLVVASDGWQTDYSAFRDAALPWLPVRVELGQAVIGPHLRPGTPGCPSCVEGRRRAARPDGSLRGPLLDRYGSRLAGSPSPMLTPLAVDTVAALVAHDVESLPGNTFRLVDLETLTTTLHRFLPDPLCPSCGTVPPDTAAAAAIALRSRPKPTPDTYRVRDLDELGPALREAYVDTEAGLVSHVHHREAYGFAVAEARIALRDNATTEYGFGRTLDHRSSGAAAILEALERYGGAVPARTRPGVQASYAEVRADALDPRELGLYPPDRHRLPGFGYQEFTEDVALHWVWGYSFRLRRAILVPASFAYYGHTFGWLRGRPLAYETSNGCALGGCLEEAILYGILEVAERDAFLLTWYARLGVPPVALDSARDRRIPLLAAKVEHASGYRIRAFATTMEQGVPAVALLATNDGGQALFTAAAHLDPERACASALAELVPMLATTPADYARQAGRVHPMVEEPDRVRAMSDHALLYCDPATAGRYSFLTGTGPERTFAEAYTAPRVRNDDLKFDVQQLVNRYLATGLDVVVVDQTAAEHEAAGLCCVKVLIPGTLPMTFGHRTRRTDGLSRLLSVPQLLGYRDRPLRTDEVNPHPHPFP
jgi:ribosomal protein S12 methylthiotransferase accessory factor